MAGPQVLLVAGTHGNEVNGPWLIEQWSKTPNLINNYGVRFASTIGNPLAFEAGVRYLDRDLNRSFRAEFLRSTDSSDRELMRARKLLDLYGPLGRNACKIAIDIHSTTASMGSCLVIYGRRSSDLALAALVQKLIGLPVYLHEEDEAQKGFLVESWPCGLVIEVGPVAQSVLQFEIVEKTRLALEACFECIASISEGSTIYPRGLIIHRHIASFDFPRDLRGNIVGLIHPLIEGKDWQPIKAGVPLFVGADGDGICVEHDECLIPVFINEAAYAEKNIAMSLTKREFWPFDVSWKNSLEGLFT